MDDESNDGREAFTAVRDRVGHHVTRFVRDLRRAGVDVPANAGIDATRALATVGFDDFWRARAALRATLLTRAEDRATLDRFFPRFWDELQAALATERDDGSSPASDATFAAGERRRDESDAESAADDDVIQDPEHTPTERPDADRSSDDWQGTRASASEGDDRAAATDVEDAAAGSSGADQRRSFGAGDATDGRERVETSVYSRVGRPEPVAVETVAADDSLEEAVRELTRSLADRPGRRWTPAAAGTHLDTRRALRRSFATGGTVVDVPRRTRRETTVRCVLLVDVSRSVLDTIDRDFLVRFLRILSAAWRDVRIFFFDSEVREVTQHFGASTADAAVLALQRAETTWGGGTRIGHAIERLRADDPQAVDRTTAVFVVSDGLEMGEIDELETGMAWLARRAGTVLWLNPLAAAAAYEPTCRGMARSLPYVDGLFAFTGPDDVREMARQVRLRGPGGAIGYEYDGRRRDR